METNVSDKIILPAFILCTFLGLFGAHRFYAGKPASAIVILLLTLSMIGIMVSGIWVFIDWIIILCGSFRDGDNKLIRKWVN
jgi:TM2 domain-containing membrane protein YozV